MDEEYHANENALMMVFDIMNANNDFLKTTINVIKQEIDSLNHQYLSLTKINTSLPVERKKVLFRKLYGNPTVDNIDPQLTNMWNSFHHEIANNAAGLPELIQYINEKMIPSIKTVSNNYESRLSNDFTNLLKQLNECVSLEHQYETDYQEYIKVCQNLEKLHSNCDTTSPKYFAAKVQYKKIKEKIDSSLGTLNYDKQKLYLDIERYLLMFEEIDKERNSHITNVFHECAKALNVFAEKNKYFSDEIYTMVNSINSYVDVLNVFDQNLFDDVKEERMTEFNVPTFDFPIDEQSAKEIFKNKLTKFTSVVTEDFEDTDSKIEFKKGDEVLVISADGPICMVKTNMNQVVAVNPEKLMRIEEQNRSLFKVISPSDHCLKTIKDEIVLAIKYEDGKALCKNVYGMKGYVQLDTLQKIEFGD